MKKIFIILLLLIIGCGKKAEEKGLLYKASKEKKLVATKNLSNKIEKNNAQSNNSHLIIDTLLYNGYTIITKSNIRDHFYKLTIKKDDKIIKSITNPSDYNYSELKQIIGEDRKQLIVGGKPAGSAGMDVLWIINLKPKYDVLFHGRYSDISFVDINNDNILELEVSEKIYISQLSNALQPYGSSLYMYNSESSSYELSNHKFIDYYFKKLEYRLINVKELKNKAEEDRSLIDDYFFRANFISKIITVVALYIYSGQEKAGWDYYDRFYILKDKEELKSEVIGRLNNNLIYEKIYPLDTLRHSKENSFSKKETYSKIKNVYKSIDSLYHEFHPVSEPNKFYLYDKTGKYLDRIKKQFNKGEYLKPLDINIEIKDKNIIKSNLENIRLYDFIISLAGDGDPNISSFILSNKFNKPFDLNYFQVFELNNGKQVIFNISPPLGIPYLFVFTLIEGKWKFNGTLDYFKNLLSVKSINMGKIGNAIGLIYGGGVGTGLERFDEKWFLITDNNSLKSILDCTRFRRDAMTTDWMKMATEVKYQGIIGGRYTLKFGIEYHREFDITDAEGETCISTGEIFYYFDKTKMKFVFDKKVSDYSFDLLGKSFPGNLIKEQMMCAEVQL